MKSERQLTALVWWVALIWALLLVGEGVVPSLSLFKPLETAAGIVILSLAAFDQWLWHWRLFHGWLVDRPDLRGTWRVNISSTWVDPSKAGTETSIEGYLVVKQTYSDLSLRLYTAESESWLRGSEILCNQDDTFDIVAVYMNEPKLEFRNRSPIHQGAFKLSVRGDPPRELQGHYWTDRNTQGSLVASDHRPERFDSFETARAGFRGDVLNPA